MATPNLGLPLIAEGQAQPHVTHNDALARLDTVIGPATGPLGSFVRLASLEFVVDLAGASVVVPLAVPDRVQVFAVTSKTLEDVTGASSYDVGRTAGSSDFGGSLGAAAGSVNKGVVGSFPTYATEAIHVTANGGDFTGGRVLLALACLVVGIE